MTKQEIIDYMYENHVQGDFKIEEMAEDLAQPQWIPCSERLPSDHERYFLTEEVHYTTGRIIRRVLMAFYDDENDEWYEEMGEDVEVVSYPLAWMPLPEPWKEGENAKLD